MNVEKATHRGWQGLLLSGNGFELFATTRVGPRILRFNLAGHDDLLQVTESADDHPPKGAWRAIGGHRFWHAPEEIPRTYWPDNDPLDVRIGADAVDFMQPVEGSTRLQKTMRIEFDAAAPVVRVTHRLANLNPWAIEAAPWALSIMAPGGRAIFPQEEYRSHPEHLLPARPLVLWHYTDMSDPRWIWGTKYIQLRHDTSRDTKQKIGLLNARRWCAYACGDQVLVKRFACIPGATYPDFQCNCETYACGDFLEVETLGPLATIPPGGHVDHVEIWHAAAMTLGESEAEIDARLLPLAESLPAE